MGRSRLDARQHAFQQRIGDLRRAVQLLEEGLQHGECRCNTDQLRVLQKLTQRSYTTCMVAHDDHFMRVRWPQNGAPVYLKGKYSEETLRKALDIVNSSMWPEFPAQGPPLMYACRGPFQRWDRNETHEMRLILQAALEIARDQGKCERFERLCPKGRSAWTFPFFFDGGKVGRYEFVYEKSAGDRVCSFWIRKHMQHSGLNWLTNDLQAFFVCWAALPYKVLTKEMARHVSRYCIHSLGDFHEILALYLSEDVLNLYMNVGGNFCLNEFSRYFWSGCSCRDEQGLLCCDKEAHGVRGTLCSSWKCQDKAGRCRQGVRVEDSPAFPVAVPSATSGSRRTRSRSRSRGRLPRDTQTLDTMRAISEGQTFFRVGGRRYEHRWKVYEG